VTRREPRARVLLLTENAPVPSDRRVWNISRALTEAGYRVTIICAQGSDRCREPFEVLEGIEIHRYPLRQAGDGILGYAREYGQAMLRTRRLVRRLARERHFDVVHAANPPDFLLLAALSLRRAGTRFVFDHHDLMPELCRTRFGDRRLPRLASLAAERVAFRVADVVISTNESYREIALRRGHRRPEDVFVVRNGPDIRWFAPVSPDPSLRRGRAHLIGYLGVMASQDGVDHAIHALAELRRRRDDWRAVFLGDGECLEEMRALVRELGLDDVVDLPGWTYDDQLRRVISTCDVCLAPDPPNPLNEMSTLVKIVEYMAMSRPVVSYDLRESRRSAGDAAVYARPGDIADFAGRIDELLSDPERRWVMGRLGRKRVETELAWEHSARRLRAAYRHALGRQLGAVADAQLPEPALQRLVAPNS
jgi:glycosyltransferase involved in cell wall biosynthesis